MADTLGIGTSGLLAFQRSMATISHNISNANTEGYSRQRTQLDTLPPQGFGNGFKGSGVKVSTVERIYDSFLVDQVRSQTTRSAELNSYHDMASRVDNLLSDSDAGITPMLQEFFNAAQGVADAPGSVPARQVLLTTAESLTERMGRMHDSLDDLNRAMTSDITNTVSQVNSLASSIADINDKIVLQSQRFGQPPNDLLDQRDEMLRKLSEHTKVSAVPQDDGAVNVFIGNGQSLVLGNSANKLFASEDQFDPFEIAIELGGPLSDGGVDVTGMLNGGSLGGMLRFKEEVLDPSINELGRVAVGLATAFNDQHTQGLNLNDELGDNFFSDFTAPGSVPVNYSSNNSADGKIDGAVTARITDAGELRAKDYTLAYDGTDYSLSRQPDGVSVPLTVAATTADETTYATEEGFEITVDETLNIQAGDRFEIRPTRTAARDIQTQLEDVSEIAAAGAVRAYPTTQFSGETNSGNASVSQGELVDGATPGGSFNVVFTNSGGATAPETDTYEIRDPDTDALITSGGYSSGTESTISHNGMEFTISGTPHEGDTFRLELNSGAESDNRNMLELAGLQTKRTLVDRGSGPTVDFQGAYGQLVSMVGTKTHQADVAGKAQESMLNQAIESRESVSGVNLDEEAANLLKFQQAYQASARVVTSAQNMFQSLLDAVR